MTQAFEDYIAKREELYRIRQGHGGVHTDAEDVVLDSMTQLWYDLSPEEKETIKSQGSWKFAASESAGFSWGFRSSLRFSSDFAAHSVASFVEDEKHAARAFTGAKR
jgi:hypothetical protein